MRKHRAVVALALLATMPVLVYAAISYPAVEPGPFLVGLALITLAGLASAFLGWRLLRRVNALQAEVEAERRRKAQFEAHSREMYRELERKLEERTAELLRERDIVVRTEKLTSLSRLVGGVAHELNNPLMAILGEAMMLRERCNTPELSHGLRVIEQQATRCASLIRDLTAFASLEQRKVQPLDLHALLEGALSQAVMVAPEQEVKVVRQYWQGPLVVTGSMEQLQQALVNVIGNAYQAMADGKPGQLIVRSRRERGGWAHLEIADSGLGIPADALPNLFTEFFRVKRLETVGITGTGLGLSIVKRIVDFYKGRVEVRSELGVGSTFAVFLPCRQTGTE